MSDPADMKEYARPRVISKGLHWPTFDRQIAQESNWRHWKSPGVVLTSYSGVAKGVGQLHEDYYPEEVWSDPYRNIDAAIDTMFRNLARFGTYRRALAAFNWGPGNVGGYTKADGTVVPPWDGRRETISAQGAHYLDVILGPGWPEPTDTVIDGIGEPPVAVTYEDYRDPGHALFKKVPKGVVLHGSRSGAAGNSLEQEYKGTANWELNNPHGYAWHATIGPGKVALHLTPKEWGQHDPWASQEYLGVEFAQPTVNNAITDSQVDAFVDWFKTRVLVDWPSIPRHFPSHAEVNHEYGQNQGKSDAFPLNDPRMDDLRARIMARLEGAPVVVPDHQYAVGPGLLAKMQAHGDRPATDEMYFKSGDRDMYSEAMGQSGAIYRYVFATNATHRYDPITSLCLGADRSAAKPGRAPAR